MEQPGHKWLLIGNAGVTGIGLTVMPHTDPIVRYFTDLETGEQRAVCSHFVILSWLSQNLERVSVVSKSMLLTNKQNKMYCGLARLFRLLSFQLRNTYLK